MLDRLTDLSERCGVSVSNGQIVISVAVGSSGTPACPGLSTDQSSGTREGAQDREGEDGDGSAGGGSAEENIRKPKPINSEHLGKEAEVLSESDDSEWGSTEAPEGELSDDGGEWSDADSNASVAVRRSLWDVASSEAHQLTHKPALPHRNHKKTHSRTRTHPRHRCRHTHPQKTRRHHSNRPRSGMDRRCQPIQIQIAQYTVSWVDVEGAGGNDDSGWADYASGLESPPAP